MRRVRPYQQYKTRNNHAQNVLFTTATVPRSGAPLFAQQLAVMIIVPPLAALDSGRKKKNLVFTGERRGDGIIGTEMW